MTDSPQSPTEKLRLQQQRDHIRAVARAMKALVRRHFQDADFEEMGEDNTLSNVEQVRFGREETGHHARPPHAMIAFHIPVEYEEDSGALEKARAALADDMQRLFGAASSDSQWSPSTGSMVMNNRYSCSAVTYGAPEALYQAMTQAMEHSTDLRLLLPRSGTDRSTGARLFG